ncbi:MAG: hypothetical protein MJ132_01500 [Clostridia bacterium]|nr:hypothetical protein [Clostridia bacterium]
MENRYQKFFLAANSCKGFVSHFADNYDPADGWQVFLVKGGPGTGKSSFMKHFAYHANQAGEVAVLCPCSSDPGSLDGVILPDKKILLLDATAPHTVDPKLPGACENLVDLGQFWNSEKLRKNAAEIMEIGQENGRFHAKAKRYLLAAGKVAEGRLSLAEACTDASRCARFTERLCHRLLPIKKAAESREWPRFLQGVTPSGIVDYTESLLPHFAKRIVLCDPFGGVGKIFMQTVRFCALRSGYEIITCYDPFLPEIVDHVLIPELSLAFFTERYIGQIPCDERRIHARRFYDVTALHGRRERLNFDRKVMTELLKEASACLKQAKAVHDDLEEFYIHAMDFPALTDFAEDFTARVLA